MEVYSLNNLRKSLDCFCNKKFFFEQLIYKVPPKCEIDFNIDKKKYLRSFFYCKNCNHWFSDLKNIDLGKLYEGNFNNSIYKNNFLKTFKKIIKLPKSKSDNFQRSTRIKIFSDNFFKNLDKKYLKVLDVGSGMGVFPYVMKKFGYDCEAVDPDKNAVKHIIKHVKIKAYLGDFLKIKSKKKYNIITFNKVLEHVVNPVLLLKHAQKFLKKNNSIIYVELPDGEQAIKTSEGKNKQEFTIDHLHVFSLQSLEKLLRLGGFMSLLSSRYIEPSGKVTISAFAKPFSSLRKN